MPILNLNAFNFVPEVVMVYVETRIRTDVATLWRHTRNPTLHARWDLRFTSIEGLIEAGAPVRFRYRTTVLPGVHIDGVGFTSGERARPDGSAVSVLRFGSADRRSLIADGSGFWRYEPVPGGVRFLTGFDYTPRWGRFGRLADRAFRPVFGWATAWSFDRLRLWLEHGVSPAASRRRWLLEVAVRVGLAVAAWRLGPVFLLLAVALPPGPRTPAARRCGRRPPTRGTTA
ncbi:hypothetical protein [Asanoa iriomotensis]|uniref:SRPBCC family protein n=1 Tax=Asanoa iriomotensis TaxID=234613 RepID=A0ABQ4BZY0_9ACTN|nr:hypothetical protein [Asanoa iriomotensis]GIF56090.1 hypothetical protein Air01nite_21850 [Asanoa iriomotensis]